MKPKRKIISLLLCAAILLSFCPTSVFAEAAAQDGGVSIGASGLCEHHTEHNEDCGYTEGTPESPCTHEHKVNGGEADREGGLGHTDECHTLIKNCVHSHTEDCYPQETVSGNVATPSDADKAEPVCGHVCSEESGCINKELDCKHEHSEDCGYAPATDGTPCGYVCKICKPQDSGPTSGQSVQKSEGDLATPSNAAALSVEDVQKLIDELPTADELAAMSLEEQQAVYTELQAAYEAYNALTDEQKAEVTGAEIFESLFDVFNGMVNTLAGEITYISYTWEDGQGRVDHSNTLNETYNEINADSSDPVTWDGNTNGGYYVVTGGTAETPITFSERVTVSENIHLILTDGCHLKAAKGITVSEGNSLTIYATSEGESMGKLTATIAQSDNSNRGAGIGGFTQYNSDDNSYDIDYASGGSIIIHGGTVTATGGTGGAGIGGGYGGNGGKITILGGKIDATGIGGAGIGGGSSTSKGSIGDGGNITIYGGEITATSTQRGAGIGGGGTSNSSRGGNGGTISIYGGIVKATGGKNSGDLGGGAGIGGGKSGDGGAINIYGGNIEAIGGNNGAGIGGGEARVNDFDTTITDGGNGGTIRITGGKVTAKSDSAAGIGGGWSVVGGANGGTIRITGGTVEATGDYCDIGSGDKNVPSDKIEITVTVTKDGTTPATIGPSHVADTTKWSSDEDQHWHPCQVPDCNVEEHKSDIAYHTWNSGTVNENNKLVYSCEVCEYEKTYSCAKIEVTTQPTLTYTEGDTLDLSALEITATFGEGGDQKQVKLPYGSENIKCYIGYSEVTNDTTLTTAHNGQTITVTWNGKTAPTAQLTVNAADAETPKIAEQPQGTTYTVGNTAAPLRVTASVSDGGTLSYQWYSNTVNETTSGTAVSGVIDSGKTESTYTPPTTAEGTTYYYCVVTNTKGVKEAKAVSNTAEIKVSPAAPTEYTITFDGNGGTSPAAQTTTGKKLTSLPTSNRSGYSFNGWYTATTGGDKITLDTVFSTNTTVYAQWTKDTPPQPTEYTITFDGNGGTSPAPQTTTGGKLTSLPTSIRDGYSFNGWYTATTGGDKITLDTVFTANVTVYAQWTKDTPPQPTEYTVTVNGSHTANSGAGSYEANKTVSIDAGSRSNYRFSGWTSSDGISFANAGSPSTTFVMPGKNVTVTANWTYNGGGGGGGTSYDYFTITASAGAGGSISPSGSFSVREGRDKTFTITPEGGYRISDVLVDGQSVGAVSSYTFDNVQKRHTIEAVFAKENPGTGVDNPFTDVHPEDWFFNDVMFVYQNGLMSGTSATTFEPNLNTTRAQIAVIFYRMDGSPEVIGDSPFTDVEYGPGTAWYYDAVLWAHQKGIVAGYGDHTYHPGDPVTREQLAVMFRNYANYKGYSLTATNDLSGFTDAGSVSDWALEAVKWAVGNGLINGYGDGTLKPQGTATRAEVAAMLHNFIERNHLVPPAVIPGGDGGAGGTGTGGGGGWTQQLPAPQTGDNTPIWPFVALPISAVGLVTSTILYCKRRKEEDEEPAYYPA